MNVCLYPDRDAYPERDEPPEGMGDEWRTSETCDHEWCAEVDGWQRQWAGERQYRESMALARSDLDMAYASEREVASAILERLK